MPIVQGPIGHHSSAVRLSLRAEDVCTLRGGLPGGIEGTKIPRRSRAVPLPSAHGAGMAAAPGLKVAADPSGIWQMEVCWDRRSWRSRRASASRASTTLTSSAIVSFFASSPARRHSKALGTVHPFAFVGVLTVIHIVITSLSLPRVRMIIRLSLLFMTSNANMIIISITTPGSGRPARLH